MLFNRKVELIIGNKSYLSDNIDIDFSVPFDSDPEPNICDVSIYNLSMDSINRIGKSTEVILNAGYGEDIGAILVGTVADYEQRNIGTDLEFKMMIAPGIDRWMSKTFSKSYKEGMKASTILRDALSSFGLEIGELRLANDITYSKGKVVSGMLKNTIKNIATEAGSKLYIKNNIAFVRPPNAGTATGFLLSSKTGMVGSPEPIIIDDKKGYKVNMLLNNKMNTDSLVQIESRIVTGNFRVVKGQHLGDFITEVEVLPI
ncbi:conserved hypothetical protein [Alkaliphilus metalliredigens QYMF]|uniref:Uncharacterized protein n=1 Tax=Alkaliphilus metalliredigens (strain QYMF) TaxID=293826 RepID=A6TKE3_ALKMQ|nr:hypothetical protein [Alkaliphilus metalliredigens]ABR46661.1 conserved hypothetical protein [Alkaliphilus metalliredigens QYMF]ABR48133.1 conserved hypothetical protein [Alkaliphilus metalliredigens QYMF]ABR50422.1 conserved hypothetical protein [Alkaliphilus metalliredigens QYMF]